MELICRHQADGLHLSICYDANLFEEEITRLGGCFCALLAHTLDMPDTPIDKLEILDETERQRVLVAWNNTQADDAQDCCIHHLFEAQVERTTDAVAVVCGADRLSYEELNRRSNQLAHYLQSLGVGSEVRVGICMERSLELVVGLLGILKAGGAYVPLDPAYPRDRLAFMVADCRAPIVLTQKLLHEKIPEHAGQTICLDRAWETIAGTQDGEETLESGVEAGNLAYTIYTSGSTGTPKGVLVTHQNLVHSTSARLQKYRQPMKGMLLLPSFAFDSSVAGIFWTLCGGGALVVPAEGQEKDPAHLKELVKAHEVTHWLSVPSLWSALLEMERGTELSGLRTVVVAGEACRRELIERHRLQLPEAELYNEYGVTEGSVWSTVSDLGQEDATGPVTIGRPISNTQVYLLDAHLQPVPAGVVGEFCIGGLGVTRGYLNRPEWTAERFIPNPFSELSGARMYRTGDLARYLPDGRIEFLGRIDHRVKIRGYRIELEEIEAVLGLHRAVRQNVVLAREDAVGDKRLAAYVVTDLDFTPTSDELQGHLADRLPDYMVPSVFVFLDVLPLTPNGKVDRSALPAPETDQPVQEKAYVAPRNSVEELLAEIWSEVLRLDQVGVYDNFLSLGGDSILSIQIAGRAARVGLQLTPGHLFEHQTLAELAEVVKMDPGARARQSPDLSLVKLETLDALPSEFCDAYPLAQMQEMFLHFYGKGIYHCQHVYRIRDTTFSLPALEKALMAVVRKNPVLRTGFITMDGQRVQAIRKEMTLPLEVEDIRHLDADAQNHRIHTWMQEDREQPFVVEDMEAPLFRLHIFLRSEDTFEFCRSIHHAMIDGWGHVALLNQLVEFYAMAKKGETLQMEASQNVYKEFVALEQEILASDEAAAFWDRHLEGHCPFLLESVAERSAGAFAEMLSPALTSRVHQWQQELQVSLKAIFLSAYLDLISSWSNREQVTAGVVSNGRSERLSDPMAATGLFWNIVPFCYSVTGEPVSRIRAVQKSLIDMDPYVTFPLKEILSRQKIEDLFFATFNFAQFHNVHQMSREGDLELLESRAHDKFHFPLNFAVEVNPFDKSLYLQVEYDSRYFDMSSIRSMAKNYITILEEYLAGVQT